MECIGQVFFVGTTTRAHKAKYRSTAGTLQNCPNEAAPHATTTTVMISFEHLSSHGRCEAAAAGATTLQKATTSNTEKTLPQPSSCNAWDATQNFTPENTPPHAHTHPRDGRAAQKDDMHY